MPEIASTDINRSNYNLGWPIKTNRFVSFFDVLGFKELVIRESHENILGKLSAVNGITSMLENYDKNNGNVLIKTVQFSDSIIQITSDDSVNSAKNLLGRTAWILAGCLANRLPVKGSIAYGMVTADLDRSIYFGQPIIDAYLLQEELKLYGSIIHHTAEYEFLNKCPDVFVKTCLKYLTPIGNSKVQHWNIDWIAPSLRLSKPIDLKVLEKLLYCSVSGAPRKYVDNTFQFVDYVLNKNQ